MLEFLAALDRQLLLLSQQHHSPTADALLLALASRWVWCLLLLPVLVLGRYSSWRRVAPGMLAVVVGVLAANGLVGMLLKPWIARPRPCQVAELLPLLHLPNGCSELFGFPSTHAADVAAVATVVWLVLPRRFNWLRGMVVLWSGTVAFSRVYVSAHYPFDVLAGALLGGACAWAVVTVLRCWWPNTLSHTPVKPYLPVRP